MSDPAPTRLQRTGFFRYTKRVDNWRISKNEREADCILKFRGSLSHEIGHRTDDGRQYIVKWECTRVMDAQWFGDLAELRQDVRIRLYDYREADIGEFVDARELKPYGPGQVIMMHEGQALRFSHFSDESYQRVA